MVTVQLEGDHIRKLYAKLICIRNLYKIPLHLTTTNLYCIYILWKQNYLKSIVKYLEGDNIGICIVGFILIDKLFRVWWRNETAKWPLPGLVGWIKNSNHFAWNDLIHKGKYNSGDTGVYITYILILVVLQPYRMLKECQLKYILRAIVLHTYKYNWLMYTHIIIQTILEKTKANIM